MWYFLKFIYNSCSLFLFVCCKCEYFVPLGQVLISSGYAGRIAQMPVVLIPIHFDRDAAVRAPSCQRSLVLRPFITGDFMTGVAALPGSDAMPQDVRPYRLPQRLLFYSNAVFQVMRVPSRLTPDGGRRNIVRQDRTQSMQVLYIDTGKQNVVNDTEYFLSVH